MPGIFPDTTAGGVVVRDADGVCQFPPNVFNAYCPPEEFTTTCEITALPSDCTARISAAQINALASELYALAEAYRPAGNWDCNVNNNLATMFHDWVGTTECRSAYSLQMWEGWAAGEVLFIVAIPEDIQFPPNFGGAQYAIVAAPPITADLLIYRNGVQVGVVNIVNNVATFSSILLTFVAGDVLTIVADDPATFTAVSLSLVGTRP